jgi:hypothetical protein
LLGNVGKSNELQEENEMRRVAMVAVLCALALTHWTAVAWAKNYKLTIRQHTQTVVLTEKRADQILARMSQILSAKDGPSDTACSITFSRHGGIGTFDSPEVPFSISSEPAFKKMTAAQGSVKVVGEIKWCGKFAPNIVGCATRPGRGLSVVRYHTNGPAAIEAVIWAHEFSHTSGNPHRDFSSALMHPSIALTHVELDADECTRLTNGSAAAAGTGSPAVVDGAPEVHVAQVAPASEAPTMPVEEFVEALWFEGTPYNLASQYSVEDVPTLEAILEDNAEAESWPTAIATLGAIGGDRARDVLIDKLLNENPNGPMSATEYLTRSNALIALGWLAAKDQDPEATRLLVDGTNYDFWASVIAEENWSSEVHATSDELIESLIANSLIGLSLSGTPEAKQRLESLAAVSSGNAATPPTQLESTAIKERIGQSGFDALVTVEEPTIDAIRSNGGGDFLSEQMKALLEVQAGGLSEYYR